VDKGIDQKLTAVLGNCGYNVTLLTLRKLGTYMKSKINAQKIKFLKFLNAFYMIYNHEKKVMTPIDILTVKRIISLESGALGDQTVQLSFYTILRRTFPDAHITLCGPNLLFENMKESGLIDDYISFNIYHMLRTPIAEYKNRKQTKEILSKINKNQYDLALEPRGDIRLIKFMHHINAKRKVSYNYSGGSYMLTDCIEPDPDIEHALDDNIHLLARIGCKVTEEDRVPHLELTLQQRKNNENFIKLYNLRNKSILGIHPGASSAIRQYKHYPEAIERVCNQLNENNFVVIVFCGPGEENIAQPIVDAVNNTRVPVLLSKEKMSIYLGRIAICNYFVGNDSGAGHVAAAYGIPLTSIFGLMIPEKWKPRSSKNVYIISHNLACKPCFLSVCPKRGNEYEACINSITVDEVANTVLKMINEN
jgi:ADP-heptose:LPS heptosyltransferase